MMSTYELRNAMREWEKEDGENDLNFPLRKDIEEMTYELERIRNVENAFREVLRSILK